MVLFADLYLYTKYGYLGFAHDKDALRAAAASRKPKPVDRKIIASFSTADQGEINLEGLEVKAATKRPVLKEAL